MSNSQLHKSSTIMNTASNIFLACCFLVVCIFGTFMYLDLRISNPMYNVTATAKETTPGGIAYLDFTYTRPNTVNAQVIDRWLTCDDGSSWKVESAAPTGNAGWPAGIDQTVRVPIKIPEAVPSGQSCYYGSKVKFSRYLLEDIILRNPPVDIKIDILNNR